MRLMKSGRVKKEDIKVEKKDGSSYYMNTQGLKKLDFLDSTIYFAGDLGLFSIKYYNEYYSSTNIYLVVDIATQNIIKLSSLAEVKHFIANNIATLQMR